MQACHCWYHEKWQNELLPRVSHFSVWTDYIIYSHSLTRGSWLLVWRGDCWQLWCNIFYWTRDEMTVNCVLYKDISDKHTRGSWWVTWSSGVREMSCLHSLSQSCQVNYRTLQSINNSSPRRWGFRLPQERQYNLIEPHLRILVHLGNSF